MKVFFLFLLKTYRIIISPFLKTLFPFWRGCRFSPSCSLYTSYMIEKYGTIKGLILGLRRILSCHPLAKN